MPTSSIYTLPIKSCVGYGYSLVPADIPIPYVFIIVFSCDTYSLVNLLIYDLEYEIVISNL
jgi:hypothetical protein